MILIELFSAVQHPSLIETAASPTSGVAKLKMRNATSIQITS
jgi:hypothetical protein